MNFSDFQKFREKILRERCAVRDAAETNLYAALAHLIPPTSAAPGRTVHRCHLASEWVGRFGFAEEDSRCALNSCGVRDSLARLFRYYAGGRATLWLPEDNYPVYHDFARSAGLSPRTFPTLPAPTWPDAAPLEEMEILLVTNPMKPLGLWLSAGDVATLKRWLAASERRRVLLDAVYTFGTEFHSSTVQLLGTGQTLLLHSLTKGWLQPRVFGVTLVPQVDLPELTPVFRTNPPAQSDLARAHEMMAQHADLPMTVAHQLAESRFRMDEQLAINTLGPLPVDAPGYFTPVRVPWNDLLEAHKILGLPATVFGSSREDLTILSSLTFLA
jgi:hypothetical protein